jgi:hypothetical protein
MKSVRSKWLLLKQPFSLDEVAQYLINQNFTKGKESGYEINSFDNTKLKAKYIEQYNHTETLIDPFGIISTFESIRYKYVSFDLIKINNGEFLLKIQNSPKSLQSFFNNLQNLFDFDVSVETIKLDVLSIVSNLKEKEEITQFKVNSIKVRDIIINKDAKSKIEITSSQDALNDFYENYSHSKYSLDQVKCSFRYKSTDVISEFKKSGIIHHSLCIDELLINEILRR